MIQKTNIDKLDEVMAKEEQILANAVAKSLSVYNKNPTGSNLKDYQLNKKAYDECKARAAGKVDEHLGTKAKVLVYLDAEGWDVKRSKLYKDLQHVPKTKGGYLKADVDMYAKLRLVRADGPVVEMDSAEKTKQEIRVTTARAEKFELENEIFKGKFILRSEVEQLHASKAHHLKTGLEGFFQSQAAMMVEVCGGDPDKVADLREFCLAEFAKHLNEYSKSCRYSVPVVPASEDLEI